MQLYKHQRDFLDNNPDKHALVWGTGSGKTTAALSIAKKKKGNFTLIIVPKGLRIQWEVAIKEFGFKGKHTVVTKEQFKKLWDKISDYECVIVDEAHYFLGMTSAINKSLVKYFKKHQTKYRYLLTATPYRSSPWDIYKMAELLDQPMNYKTFASRFFDYIPMGRRIIPQVKADIEDDIAQIVKRIGSTVRLEDCTDVPDQIFETEYFELTDEQKKAMERVEDILPIVRFTKYHQICGGTLKGDEYVPSQFFSSYKLERLKEHLADNKRAIVVCRYNHELEYLAEKLGEERDCYIINGATPAKERADILKELAGRDSYVLLVNAACSEGWELAACPLMIFYSYGFGLVQYIQMMGRIQRINNIKKNTYLSLVVKDSIDEKIFESITIKKTDFHLKLYKD